MTFDGIWEEFIEHKRKRVKPTSVAAYVTLWKKLQPVFGNMEIETITTKSIEDWAINLLTSICRKSIIDRIILLNNMMEYYAYEYDMPVNKIRPKYIRWPTINAEDEENAEVLKSFTSQEIVALLGKIAQDPLPTNILVALMIGTGMRIGEACALTYSCINIDSGTVAIKRTLERVTIGESFCEEDFERMNVKILHKAKKSAIVISPPKCKSSRRSVPVPAELLRVFKKLIAIYPAGYYIGSNNKRPVEPRTLRARYYELLKQAGIERKFSPHALRHTYATTLITSGADVTTTAALLGHSNTSTTLNVYAHATPESKKKAMIATIGKQFKGLLSKK